VLQAVSVVHGLGCGPGSGQPVAVKVMTGVRLRRETYMVNKN
jgi:hypothetical protein